MEQSTWGRSIGINLKIIIINKIGICFLHTKMLLMILILGNGLIAMINMLDFPGIPVLSIGLIVTGIHGVMKKCMVNPMLLFMLQCLAILPLTKACYNCCMLGFIF